ncbi:DUF7594 domain-containing protein [Persicobacter diffluens]|uniref:Uncharacterized protein n=1 Tax=Persicobacter diffluens TaxID=981 RepID=A0AAN5AMK3_9BACT|nr:hypothetical protein PEDI_44490 [Persicobacter diffluens]
MKFRFDRWSFIVACLTFFTITLCNTSNAEHIQVNNAQQLVNALKNANTGDVIILASGTYLTSPTTYYYPLAGYYEPLEGDIAGRTAYFRGSQDNITIRSADPAQPAILSGNNWNEEGYVLHITGNNWTIQDLKLTNGAKGLILDNASNTLVRNVEIYNIGQEGLHIRDHSHDCVVDNVHIHDVGKKNDGFGEGIYIGSDNSVWYEGDGTDTGEKGKRYRRACHNNWIKNSTFGPNISAEPVEIKEGSENTIVENCIIRGSGISGANFADSHLDIKGTFTQIRYNHFYQDGNYTIDQSIMVVPRQNAGVEQQYTAHDNYIYGNTFDLNDDGVEMVVANSGSEAIFAWNNTRIPASGATYNSRVENYHPGTLKTGTGAKGSSCHLAVPEKSYQLDGGAGSLSFEIITEESFSVGTNQNWVSASRSGNIITLTYQANTSGGERAGEIQINGCLDIEIALTQSTGEAPCSLKPESSTLSFTAISGTATILVESSENFTVSDDQSWITATQQAGAVEISVLENNNAGTRSGTVTLSGCETKTITVSQSGIENSCSLVLSKNTHHFSDQAGSVTVQVTSNESFTASADQSWISTSISGNDLIVSVSPNEQSSSRSGTITVNGCEQQTLQITQAGKPTTGSGVVIEVAEDAYVREDKPTNNYGTATSLRAEQLPAEDQEIFLKFDLSAYASTDISLANLRLYPYSGSGATNKLYIANNSAWSEQSINWNNKPDFGSAIKSWYVDNDDQFFYIDITSTIKQYAGQDITLVITGAAQDDIRYRSKEAGVNIPMLLLNNPPEDFNQLRKEISPVPAAFRIFPNPNRTRYLKVEGGQGEIRIYNLQGVLVNSAHQSVIDISSLPAGVYIVQSGRATKKFIRQ